jgi:methylated-DNA-[protein]-cysteine S-methyltransferase
MTSTIMLRSADLPTPGPAPRLSLPDFVRFDSPVGRIEIESRLDAIVRLDIERDGGLPHDGQPESPTPLLDEARRQVEGYFEGRRRRFDLPIDQAGTPFQRDVWARLAEIRWGTASSYGRLAALADRPLGARAIGGAIRANAVALLVPCHRVLGANRALTGYSPGQGVATKRWLLEHEGIEFVE